MNFRVLTVFVVVVLVAISFGNYNVLAKKKRHLKSNGKRVLACSYFKPRDLISKIGIMICEHVQMKKTCRRDEGFILFGTWTKFPIKSILNTFLSNFLAQTSLHHFWRSFSQFRSTKSIFSRINCTFLNLKVFPLLFA